MAKSRRILAFWKIKKAKIPKLDENPPKGLLGKNQPLETVVIIYIGLYILLNAIKVYMCRAL